MRTFLVLCLISFAVADVSELVDDGYNYARPGGSGGEFLTSGGRGPGSGSDLGSGSSLEPSLSEAFGPSGAFDSAGGPGLSGSGVAGDAAPTVSKRFFTVTGQDHDDADDDEDSSSSQLTGHKNIDVVFANNPATSSLKSTLKALSRFAGEQQTAVYVLSQQLGAKQIGEALRASGIKPSKPQVHFIKYKTPEEAAHAQQQIRARYNALGGSTHDGGEATAPVQSVIGSLGRGHRHGSAGRYGHGPAHGSSDFLGGRRPSYGSGSGYSYGGRPSGTSTSGLSHRYLPPRY